MRDLPLLAHEILVYRSPTGMACRMKQRDNGWAGNFTWGNWPSTAKETSTNLYIYFHRPYNAIPYEILAHTTIPTGKLGIPEYPRSHWQTLPISSESEFTSSPCVRYEHT
ncbi:hypothetical protein ACRALDRAFT_213378 [Sodiomyces alcalophilus JCM 7366]